MPLNEANGYPSNLSRKQQQEAMEAIYGANVTPTAEQQADLTFEEVERLRRILDRYDKAQPNRKEFDLAKPPVPPYVFRPYPMLMYNHLTRKTQAARSSLEQTALEAEGFIGEPFTAEASAPELSAKEQLDSARLDILLKMSPEDFDAMVAASKEPEKAERKRKT